MTEEPLADVLLRMAHGERAALRNHYSEVGPKLFGVCLRMLKDRAEAEDALQEIMVKWGRKAHQFDPMRGQPMPWVLTVARNHCLDRLRSRTVALRREAAGLNDAAMLEVDDAGPGPETLVEMKDEARRIADCPAMLDMDSPHGALGYRVPAPEVFIAVGQGPAMHYLLTRTTRWGHLR